MLTGMTEADWDIVLEVFRGCLPRRGDKARDDRRFLEALHFFTVQNVSWRALPAEHGKWNSIWKRFSRLSARDARKPPRTSSRSSRSPAA